MIKQMNNPTDNERHEQLMAALNELNRVEDFPYIIGYTKPAKPITTILPEGSLKGKNIGVIGAGSAGLASSYELRKLGCDITILEANKERIGGRIYTHYFDKEKDVYGELGAMRIPVAHESTWHYINELKLETNPFIQMSENNILYVKNMRFTGLEMDYEATQALYPRFGLNPKSYMSPLSKLVEYVYNQPILNMPVAERGLILAIRREYPYYMDLYDQQNFQTICRLLGLNREATDLINSVIGADSGFFYFNFLEILKEAYPASFYYLYEIKGGLSKLPYALYDSFKKLKPEWGRVDVRMGMRVTGIYNYQDKVILRYLNKYNNTFYQQEFDYVICANPFSTLRLIDIKPLFTNEKMQAIQEVNYSPSQKTLILFNERFWEKTINNKTILGGRIITDLPIISSWFPSHAFKENYGVILAAYNMNLDTTRLTNVAPEYCIYEVLRQLEQCFGFPYGYLNSKMVDYKIFNWNQNEYSLGAFVKYYQGQNSLFAYPSYTPEYNNKVYFVGEHAGASHGWIQAALQSATFVVNLLAENEKNKNWKT